MNMKDETITERRKNMINIMSQNEEFIIIGLTGRIGSGCSEAAEVLASDFTQLELPRIQPGSNGLIDNTERERRILQRYAQAHWLKFDIIKTRSVITLFLLDAMDDFIEHFNNNASGETISKEHIYELLEQKIKNTFACSAPSQDLDNTKNLSETCIRMKKQCVDYVEDFNKTLRRMDACPAGDTKVDMQNIFNNIFDVIEKNGLEDESVLEQCTEAVNKLERFYRTSESSDTGKNQCDRGIFIPKIEQILCLISKIAEAHILVRYKDNFWECLSTIKNSLDTDPIDGVLSNDDSVGRQNRYKRFVFVHDIINDLGDVIHDLTNQSELPFTELFQKLGNSIRRYGKIVFSKSPPSESDSSPIEKIDIFSIPSAIVKFIKVLRHPFSGNEGRPIRVAIDSIKSVFEADYLRQRYSSFYLFAISADDSIRKRRLMNKKKLTMQQIKFVDWNEYSSEGSKIYNKESPIGDEKEFSEQIKKSDNSLLYDDVRKYAYENNLQQFYLQDVAASIENADIFISNNHDNTISKNIELRWSIVRNVCLIMFPGLLMPTPIERCMQIAFAAKCNSGCLSRQVGAVVTDKNYNILSIGWNDVPCGDISCSLKNLVDLCKWEDMQAYTDYELKNPEFRSLLTEFNYKNISRTLLGLPMRYCFKDIHIKERNPMRSRAMHAEEKALASCGDACDGGFLFTTSSPCEMCSKNAKNHRIKKIYYIELYPGISETQYSQSGAENNRAEHILFTGAIGRAYTKMYTPFMPQKDILNMLGVNEACWPTKKTSSQKE